MALMIKGIIPRGPHRFTYETKNKTVFRVLGYKSGCDANPLVGMLKKVVFLSNEKAASHRTKKNPHLFERVLKPKIHWCHGLPWRLMLMDAAHQWRVEMMGNLTEWWNTTFRTKKNFGCFLFDGYVSPFKIWLSWGYLRSISWGENPCSFLQFALQKKW